MKIDIGPYVNWIGPYQIAEKLLFWLDKDEDDRVHELGKFLAHGFNKKIPGEPQKKTWLYRFCSWIHSKKQRRVKIRIDRYDSWSADHTLALIILPVLKQLRSTVHGAPFIDIADTPPELHPTPEERVQMESDPGFTDENFFKRWDWILGEMIWAFEQEVKDDDETQFYDHSECTGDLDNLNNDLARVKVDREGLMAHNKRKANGFLLFGKYYQGLWD